MNDDYYPPSPQHSPGDTEDDRSSTSSVEYVDETGLVEDLQSLLAGNHPTSDCVAVVGPHRPEELALHVQMLCARSSFFAAAFRHPRLPPLSIRLPHLDPHAFQDVLEFLYTGAVRLELSSGSAVHVAAAAHFLAIDELEITVLQHLRENLTTDSFLQHLSAALAVPEGAVPDSIVSLMAQYATRNARSILTSLTQVQDRVSDDNPVSVTEPTNSFKLVRSMWRLFAYHTVSALSASSRDRASVATALVQWSQAVAKDKAVQNSTSSADDSTDASAAPLCNPSTNTVDMQWQPLVQIVQSLQSLEERGALLSVLNFADPIVQLSLPSALRADNLSVADRPGTLLVDLDAHPLYRFEFESSHPFLNDGPSSCVRTSIFLPDGAIGCRVEFDARTSLGKGTTLTFHVVDSDVEDRVVLRLQGESDDALLLAAGLDMPSSSCWFCVKKHNDMGFLRGSTKGNDILSRWGYRFLVLPYYVGRSDFVRTNTESYPLEDVRTDLPLGMYIDSLD